MAPSSDPVAPPLGPPPRTGRSRKGILILAALTLAAGAAVLLRPPPPPPLPPPVTLRVGQNWTDVDLVTLKGAPFASVTTAVPLRFRTDGQRLQTVQPGGGLAIHTSGLQRLEVRTVRGNAEVTFTPQAK